MKADFANKAIADKAPDATGVEALRKVPTMTPGELFKAKVIPGTRNGLYAALERGEIESFRLGKKIVIPTAPLLRKLGVAV